MEGIIEQRDALTARLEEATTKWRNLGEEFHDLLGKGKDGEWANDTDAARAMNLLEERRDVGKQRDRLEEQLSEMPKPRPFGGHQVKIDDLNPFERFCAFGSSKLTGEEVKDHCTDLIQPQGDRLGFRIDVRDFRPQAATDFGASTIGTVAPGLMEKLAFYGDTARACRQYLTPYGTDLVVTAEDDSLQEGEWVEPTGPATSTGGDLAATTKVNFAQYRVTSKIIAINKVSQRDVLAFDVAGEVQDRAYRRLGRAFEDGFVLGTGAGNKPRGIKASSDGTATRLTTATAKVFTLDEMVNVRYRIDRAYRNRGPEGRYGFMSNRRDGMIGYLVSDSMEQALHALDNASSGRRNPKITPSMEPGVPDLWDGFPIIVSGKMDETGTTGNIPAIFGNFAYYGVRFIDTVEVFRWDNDTPTITANEIRFLVQTWADGIPVGGQISGSGRNAWTTDALAPLKLK